MKGPTAGTSRHDGHEREPAGRAACRPTGRTPGTPAGGLEPALLLNATYEPLRVVPWQRAVVLHHLGKADVLEIHDREIRSMRVTLTLPAVLRLRNRVAVRHAAVPFTRANLFARDRSRCQYCGRRLSIRELTYDHVRPRRHGGKTEWTNVVACCVPCNRRKGARTPEAAGMRLRSEPRRPRQVAFWVTAGPRSIPPTWTPYLPALPREPGATAGPDRLS